MNIKNQKLVIGSLLHDFGKLLYRYNDGRNHSTSGYDYLKKINALANEEDILNCVRYHHLAMLKYAKVSDDALCYITYIADNIASAIDRRAKDDAEGGFVKNIAFESVFNILNGNKQEMVYSPKVLSENMEINYPTESEIEFNESFYSKIVDNLNNTINTINFDNNYINSLLQSLELNLTFIPSSTQTKELRDISLYDHLKLTAAFALCIKQYLDEKEENNYKKILFQESKQFYEVNAFRLYSLDLSGIQDFIYNISSKSALKGLRARSFYLEILMENAVDELLDRLDLCRTNVMYTGGGHTYILVSATNKTAEIIKEFESELNAWFLEKLGTALFAAGGFADCSSNSLKNEPQGSYGEIFRAVSKSISERKLNRYSSKDILKLNNKKINDHSRECVICNRSDELNKDNQCSICSGLLSLSNMIIEDNNSFFVILKDKKTTNSVEMPFGYYLTALSLEDTKKVIQNSDVYVRAYSKNKGFTGKNIASNLWIGDYVYENMFSKLITNSDGIKRLAVIRADIDNLGQTFVSGFDKSGDNGKYSTITRTAVLSRKLSLFFKLHINQILQNGEFQLSANGQKIRKCVVVYSGGDDLFIVGNWEDVICFSVDLYNCFKKFNQGTLTLSAGIGIYPEKYPIYTMAEETGNLEEMSKKYIDKISGQEKNAVTLFDKTGSYSWQRLIDDVIGEKLEALKSFITEDSEHNKAMLYKMLELIRAKEKEDRLNIARFAYLLARLEPKEDAEETVKERYKEFSRKMYSWIQNEEDCRSLVTAIYIYVYMNRKGEGDNNEDVK